MNYKDIDNIVWLIPIRKVRDSLRNYMAKLIEDNEFLKKDNEFIKFQNNFIIKELYEKRKQGKEELLEKELNINSLSDFWKKYNKINDSYKEVCIYLGLGTGFFSDINGTGFPNDKDNKGWQEFFMPFCNELIYNANSEFSGIFNFPKNEVEILLPIMKEKYKIDYFGYMGSDIFNKMRSNDFRNSHFNIKELGIEGDLRNAFGIIAKNLFRFNNETQKEISKLVESLNLPKKYIGFYMRGGDKITEAELVEPEKYIERLKEHSKIKDIFISSDDYDIIKKLQDKHGNEYNIYTLDKNKIGFHLYDFLSLTEEDKHNHHIKFLASMEILLNSELCFGTYTSNPSSFLGAILGKSKFIDVDYIDFFIM